MFILNVLYADVLLTQSTTVLTLEYARKKTSNNIIKHAHL